LRGEDLWHSLKEDPNIKRFHEIFDLGLTLFGEAARSFDIGALFGSAILSRSSLEATLYVFLTRSKDGQGEKVWVVHHPMRLDGSPREVGFAEIIQTIGKREILSLNQMASARRVQEDGNVIAHVASRRDRILSGKTRGKSWISKNSAWENMEDVAGIILTLARAIAKNPNVAGPDSRVKYVFVETRIVTLKRDAG